MGMGATISAKRKRTGVIGDAQEMTLIPECFFQVEVYEGEFVAGNQCGHGLCFKEDGSMYVLCCCCCCCCC